MNIYEFDELGILYGPITICEVPGLGFPLPSNAIEVEDLLVAADAGKVWVNVDGVPTQVIDQRGTVYSVTTGAPKEWRTLEELPSEYTRVPCPGVHYAWNGTVWLLDASLAAQAQRDQLMGVANQATIGMADAFIAGLLSDADAKTFKAYAAYKLALSKVDQQAGYPTTIDWPTSP
jgi:hypothetical protein